MGDRCLLLATYFLTAEASLYRLAQIRQVRMQFHKKAVIGQRINAVRMTVFNSESTVRGTHPRVLTSLLRVFIVCPLQVLPSFDMTN